MKMAKNRIYAGPTDGANKKPLLAEVTNNSGGNLRSGLMVQIVDNTATSPTGPTNFGLSGAVVKEEPSTRGGGIDDTFANGEKITVILPRSGDYINGFVFSGTTVTKGAAFTADAAGFFAPAATDGTENVLYIADENSASGAERLVRFRKL
jgi:hypothetical protein